MNLAGRSENSEDKGGGEEEEVEEMEVESDKTLSRRPQMLRQTRVTSRTSREGKKGSKKPPKTTEETGGCFVCGVDNDYQNVSLCCVSGNGIFWRSQKSLAVEPGMEEV